MVSMKKRSLKINFFVLFTVFIVAICVIISLISIIQNTKMVTSIYSGQSLAIINKASELIDGDSFDALVNSMDGDDPFYEETRLRLLDLKNLSGCKYLYTMAPVNGSVWKYIIDGSTTPDNEEEFSALGTEEDVSSYGAIFFQAFKTKETKISKIENQDEWGWMLSTYSPIINSKGDAVGIIGCDFDASEIVAEITKQIVIQVVVGVLAIAIGFAIMIFFMRIIFNRLNTINEILEEIASGEGDLTRRIKIIRHDEIGGLAHYFNLTLEKIANLITIIKNQSGILSNIGSKLADEMHNTAGAINHITGNIKNVEEKVINQSASVTETGITMDQVTKNIEKLNNNVEEQTVSVTQSSSAIEEMLANIQSVTRTLIKNSENMKELTEASEVGRNGLQAVSQDIHEIARESEGLMEINTVIQSIARQTNLLSMNAAIEAAHAGEAGKGFAVVADEIRKLAEDSGEQSKIVSDILKNITTAIDAITNSTNTVLEKFQAIDSQIKIVSEQEASIRRAMEEQGTGSKQVLEAISRLNELTQMVKGGSAEMFLGSKEVFKESINLETLTNEITANMSQISEGANQIEVAVNRVNEISDSNKEHIDTLMKEVSRFKTE